MDELDMKGAFDAVRASSPLVHSITNYVTVNDCANALLAIGASPIMSDEPEDVVDITSICAGLVLNIGTLNARTVAGMHAAAAQSASLGHSIVLDPVGAGASKLRTRTAAQLLDAYPICIVRGNMSEVKALAGGAALTRGVDVCPADAVTEDNVKTSAAFARDFAAQTTCVVAITGAIDLVSDAQRTFAIRNGSALQGRITGAGCMLSCITGAFAAAHATDPLLAAVAAVASMGVAGDVAQARMGADDGNASFRTYLIDALYNLDGAHLAARARIEEVAGLAPNATVDGERA